MALGGNRDPKASSRLIRNRIDTVWHWGGDACGIQKKAPDADVKVPRGLCRDRRGRFTSMISSVHRRQLRQQAVLRGEGNALRIH